MARPEEEVPRAGAGREGVKAERGAAYGRRTHLFAGQQAGGAQVRRQWCPAGEEGRGRVAARLALGG